MKKTAIFLLLACSAQAAHAYNLILDVESMGKDQKVQASYVFENESVKITLPKRGRLVSVTSPGKPNVTLFNNGNVISIGNVRQDYQGKINIVYTLSSAEAEFYREDWYPETDEKGSATVHFKAAPGYEGLIIPYESKTGDGFIIKTESRPLLIQGKYQHADDAYGNRTFDIFYQFKLLSDVSNISALVSAYEASLSPLPQRRCVFITLPALQNRAYLTPQTAFMIVNSTSAEDVRRALASLWFKELWALPDEWVNALSDCYRRMFNDNGQPQTDDGQRIAVPNYPYYQNVIEKGFPSESEIKCDSGNLENNFALLHLAYYTLGTKRFLEGMKLFASDTNRSVSRLAQSFTNAGEALPAVNFTLEQLLPVARWRPDLSARGQFAYRNHDSIPDCYAQVGTNRLSITWGNRRAVDLGTPNGKTFLDPGSAIPQLNFFNDKLFAEPREAAEWKLAEQAVTAHKRYPGETQREFLNLEKYTAPAKNAWNLPEGSVVYVGIVKIMATVRGKLTTALKEVVLTVNNGKAVVLADRIRI